MAAGYASRFGATKQLAVFDGVPLVQHAIAAARQVFGGKLLTVLGHDSAAVAGALGPDAGFAVVNDDYARGLGGSIARAANALAGDADAIVVLLADQPMITARHLAALKDAWSGAADEIVATAFADTCGPPVLFPRDCFDELAALQGDSGGRHLLENDRFAVKRIIFEGAAVDIDNPADLDVAVAGGLFVDHRGAQRSES